MSGFLCFQLSNEMQLSIMNKVKSGELSIEDALNQAREGSKQLFSQKGRAEEVRPCGPKGSFENGMICILFFTPS